MLRMGRSNKHEMVAPGANEPAPNARQEQATPPSSPFAPPSAGRTETQPAPRPAYAAAPPEQAQGVPQPQGAPTRAMTENESLARGMKDGGVGGFVGGTSALAGEINFKGMMRVDGQISGHVKSPDGTLIVSSGGRVEAEIAVAVAKINGTVAGDIICTERVELGRTARVRGNILTPALIIEEGAIFEGGCRMTSAASQSPARVRNAA